MHRPPPEGAALLRLPVGCLLASSWPPGPSLGMGDVLRSENNAGVCRAGAGQGGQEGGTGLIIMELALLIKFNQFKAVFWVLNFTARFIAWS